MNGEIIDRKVCRRLNENVWKCRCVAWWEMHFYVSV